MVSEHNFNGRKVVIATKHQKEQVIGPALQEAFGMEYIVSENVDTDILGTFTGEVERVLTPVEAARGKCILALAECDADFAIGSEGSFGPHATLYFLPADEEYLVLMNREQDLEIAVKLTSLNTNYASFELGAELNLFDFLQQVKFPSHGLHVKSPEAYVAKGIRSEDRLNQAIQEAVNRFGTYTLETDMRAMNNPTRMSVIEELAAKLVVKMKSCCPTCQRPGFSPTDVIRGLVCSCCSLPTKSVKSLIYCCEGCHYTTCVDFPDSKTTEDPMFCDFCNP
jgi:hypothetical protein